ncbi:MAG TPA: phenylalanine--tRNA ligase subunit beta [Terriglobales bacterium]|nr:phenylalanine--tRNA ligase subunit beta [Terriglobales bacterium]
MKLLPSWIREFVSVPADDRQLAEALTSAGISVEGIDQLDGENVYEVEIGTNRVDAMNHYGVARECSAIYNTELKPLASVVGERSAAGDPAISQVSAEKRGANPGHFPIQIDAPDLCARYTGQVVRGVRIKESPERIARRLTLLGSRPINNGADATNYALWELGHPTHAFDLDLLEGKIIVRLARQGETIKTLDGVDRQLTPQDLVIADASKPVAIAGVMGGFDSMITEKTRNILIEAAWFDPATVRRTARRLGMHTDASHRFERGADFAITAAAARRVAELILASGGGQIESGPIDVIGHQIERPTLPLRLSEVKRILGQDIPEDEIIRILTRLGFQVAGGHPLRVTVPTWRLDVEREIDLIEEVARIYGYDRFPDTLPSFSGGVVELPDARKESRMRADLLALGYNEAISLSFISHQEARQFSAATIVEIANPLSEEASVMRTSMVPGMLGMLAWNLNRGVNDARLFEAGNIYEKSSHQTRELRRICLGATGNANEVSVHEKPRPYSFFDLKGDIETLLTAFQSQSLCYQPGDGKRGAKISGVSAADYYHPGRSAAAVMDGELVARFGQIHPRIAAERKLRKDVFIAELDLERLFHHPLREPRYTPVSKFPAVDRDFSFIFDDRVTFEQIQAAVSALRLPHIQTFLPVEIFRGGGVPTGKYSVLLRAEFQSSERTLRDEEVSGWSEQIANVLRSLGGGQRV